jgi:hypothetical protein
MLMVVFTPGDSTAELTAEWQRSLAARFRDHDDHDNHERNERAPEAARDRATLDLDTDAAKQAGRGLHENAL